MHQYRAGQIAPVMHIHPLSFNRPLRSLTQHHSVWTRWMSTRLRYSFHCSDYPNTICTHRHDIWLHLCLPHRTCWSHWQLYRPTLRDCHLFKNSKYAQTWCCSYANELGHLTQGIRDFPGTNTMFVIHKQDIPTKYLKDIMYSCIVVSYQPQKKERECTKLTIGGNRIDYPG